MNVNIFELIGFLALMAVFLYFDHIQYKRMKHFLDRIMATNYQEFQYYDKKYDEDLKTLKKTREVMLEDEGKDQDPEGTILGTPEGEIVETPLSLEDFEEDWKEES